MCCTRLAEKYRTEKSPSRHHRTILSDYIFATKACIDNLKKDLLNINTFSTCAHNMVNFGTITVENCWRVWGTPANFNGFRVLAALLHGTLAVGFSQTLRHWTEGATYIRQGSHHVWANAFSGSCRPLSNTSPKNQTRFADFAHLRINGRWTITVDSVVSGPVGAKSGFWEF